MKTILVDDEIHMLKKMKKLLENEDEFEIVGSYSCSETCLAEIKEKQFDIDLVFLDIEMPRMKGLILAQELLNIDENIDVVFVTAYDKYAVKAFEINALDYLLKPVTKERFQKTINRVVKDKEKVRENKKINFKVSCLGNFKMSDATGQELKVDWFTYKAKELFLYLLYHRGDMVSSSEIMDKIWADKRADKSANILYTTVYQLRKMFNKMGYPDIIQSKRGYYNVNINKIDYDVDLMVKLIEECDEIYENNIDKVREVIKIYQDQFIADENYVWSYGFRVHLKNRFKDIILRAADYYIDKKEYHKADKMLKRLIEEDSIDEKSHKKLIDLYQLMGEKLLAKKQLEKLKKIYQDEFGIETEIDESDFDFS